MATRATLTGGLSTSQDSGAALKAAELQFKFAIGLSAVATTTAESLTGDLHVFSWGKHTLASEELFLTLEQERLAAAIFEHSATYLMMQALDFALNEKHGEARLDTPGSRLGSAAWIARLIRNAFAHDPFSPEWRIDRRVRNTRLSFDDVIALDTGSLSGQRVRREHYGGPIAVLRLLQACRLHFL